LGVSESLKFKCIVNVYVIGKHIGPIQSCNLFVFIFLIGSFFSVIHISLESIRACMPRGCCFTTVNSTFNTYTFILASENDTAIKKIH